MADYHYVSTWQLQAPIEQVWAALNDLEHLPVWYAGVQEARELVPGDALVVKLARPGCPGGGPSCTAAPQASLSAASSKREVTPVFANTLRRWKSTVLGLTNNCEAMSRLDIPRQTS